MIDVIDRCENCDSLPKFAPIYPLSMTIEQKIEKIATEIYGASGVAYSAAAKKAIKEITDLGFGELPVCMAKTQYSLSDDPKKLGRPQGFIINVSEVRLSAGARICRGPDRFDHDDARTAVPSECRTD